MNDQEELRKVVSSYKTTVIVFGIVIVVVCFAFAATQVLVVPRLVTNALVNYYADNTLEVTE